MKTTRSFTKLLGAVAACAGTLVAVALVDHLTSPPETERTVNVVSAPTLATVGNARLAKDGFTLAPPTRPPRVRQAQAEDLALTYRNGSVKESVLAHVLEWPSPNDVWIISIDPANGAYPKAVVDGTPYRFLILFIDADTGTLLTEYAGS